VRPILVHLALLAAAVAVALLVVDRADLGPSPAAVALVTVVVAHALIEVVRWAETPDARLPAHATLQYGDRLRDDRSDGRADGDRSAGVPEGRSVADSERVTPARLLAITLVVCVAMTVVWLAPFDAWWWSVVSYAPSLALVVLLFNVPLTLWFRRPSATGDGGRAVVR